MFTNHIIKYIPDESPSVSKAGLSIASQLRDIILATHPSLTASKSDFPTDILFDGVKVYEIAYGNTSGISYVQFNMSIYNSWVSNFGFKFYYSTSSYSEYKLTVFQTDNLILFKKGHMPALEKGACFGFLRDINGEWFYYAEGHHETTLIFAYSSSNGIYRLTTSKWLVWQGQSKQSYSYLDRDLHYIPSVFRDGDGNYIEFESIKSIIYTVLPEGHYTDDTNRFCCIASGVTMMLMS